VANISCIFRAMITSAISKNYIEMGEECDNRCKKKLTVDAGKVWGV